MTTCLKYNEATGTTEGSSMFSDFLDTRLEATLKTEVHACPLQFYFAPALAHPLEYVHVDSPPPSPGDNTDGEEENTVRNDNNDAIPFDEAHDESSDEDEDLYPTDSEENAYNTLRDALRVVADKKLLTAENVKSIFAALDPVEVNRNVLKDMLWCAAKQPLAVAEYSFRTLAKHSVKQSNHYQCFVKVMQTLSLVYLTDTLFTVRGAVERGTKWTPLVQLGIAALHVMHAEGPRRISAHVPQELPSASPPSLPPPSIPQFVDAAMRALSIG